jgi:hypothetical protein
MSIGYIILLVVVFVIGLVLGTILAGSSSNEGLPSKEVKTDNKTKETNSSGHPDGCECFECKPYGLSGDSAATRPPYG